MRIAAGMTIIVSTVALMAILELLYALPGSSLFGSTSILLPAFILVTASCVMATSLLMARNFYPLRKLLKAAEQMAAGKIASEVYKGTITPAKIKKSNELAQLVLAFESMRRRLVYLEEELKRINKEKVAEMESTQSQLIEQERALRLSNAKIAGQDDELNRVNAGLSATNLELSDAYKRLQELDRRKSDFVMIAAHELRTPIQPILGFVELAEKGQINMKDAFKVIGSEARRLANISTDLLDAGRIESGTFTYDLKPISIARLVEDVSALSSKFATQDGVVTIHTELDQDLKIDGDRDRLIQAIENIINNAIKFSKGDKISIRTRNDYENSFVEIKISDKGPGIPPEILPILFDKFVTRTEANQRGTGLGLFISKTIVEAHGGKLSAENNGGSLGNGATFTISLPMAAGDRSAKSAGKNAYIESPIA